MTREKTFALLKSGANSEQRYAALAIQNYVHNHPDADDNELGWGVTEGGAFMHRWEERDENGELHCYEGTPDWFEDVIAFVRSGETLPYASKAAGPSGDNQEEGQTMETTTAATSNQIERALAVVRKCAAALSNEPQLAQYLSELSAGRLSDELRAEVETRIATTYGMAEAMRRDSAVLGVDDATVTRAWRWAEVWVHIYLALLADEEREYTPYNPNLTLEQDLAALTA